MRLWTIHPKYLDSKGLVALWRESLLAQKVLHGKTKGYTRHPQLDRFKECGEPIKAISLYLFAVLQEAQLRGYAFDETKILVKPQNKEAFIDVNRGQIHYEFAFLKYKLRKRDQNKLKEIEYVNKIEVHPIFKAVNGSIAPWEKIYK